MFYKFFLSEAHPIDVASVHCCGAGKEEELLLQNFHDNMDLLTLLSLQSDGDFLKPFGKRKPNKPLKEWLMPTENETFIESPSVESIFTVTVNLSDSPDSMNGKRSSSDSGDQDLNEEQKTTVINNATTITENQRMVEDHEKIDISTRSQQSVFSEVFNQTQGPSVPDQNQTNAKETNGSITPSPTLLNDKRENTPIDDALSPISDNSKTVQKNNNVKLASSLEYPGTGYVTYLGEITDELTQSNTVEEDYHECTSATNIEMSTESPPLQDDSYREKILPVEGQVWSGTKSVLSNVQRDTLYSSGFSGVTGIGLMGMERNNSSVQFRYVKLKPNYEVLSCPAQPFTLRFSILGEMFGVN